MRGKSAQYEVQLMQLVCCESAHFVKKMMIKKNRVLGVAALLLAAPLLAPALAYANPTDEPSDPTGTASESPSPSADSDAIPFVPQPLSERSRKSYISTKEVRANSAAPLLNSSLTAGYFDINNKKVYAGTRTSIPPRLFVTDLYHPSPDGPRYYPSIGNGSWEMAKSGNLLAIGGMGGWKTTTTWVQAFNTDTNSLGSRVTLSGDIVWSLAEDTFESNPGDGVFWAGTYSEWGARLYRINLKTGEAEQRGSWSGTMKYPRSLSVSKYGVTIGLSTPASIFRITSKGAAPSEDLNWTQAVSGTEFIYSQAFTPGFGSNPVPLTLIGTEKAAAASLVVMNTETGQLIAKHSMPGKNTVDRITVDADGKTAWFTTRFEGNLYKLDLTNPAASPLEAVNEPPILGEETRALSSDASNVYGISGNSRMWIFNKGTKQTRVEPLSNPSDEVLDKSVMGIEIFNNKLLVGGNWRYQVHEAGTSRALHIPGEPKAQVIAGNRLYAAIYPAGLITAVNPDLSTEQVMKINTSHKRPAAIEYNDQSGDKPLLMAIGPPTGEYRGALVASGTQENAAFHTYTNPVGDQKVTALAPYSNGYLIGTSAEGESQGSARGNHAQVRFWTPNGDSETGTTHWTVNIARALEVKGVEYVADSAGGIAFAVGTLYGGTSGWAAGIDARTGRLLWFETMPNSIPSALAQEDGYLVGLFNGEVRQLGVSRVKMQGTANVDARIFNKNYVDLYYNESTQKLRLAATSGTEYQDVILNRRRVPYRIWGRDRFDTAVKVSESTYASADTVVIASSAGFADSVSAAPLAAKLNAPLLLVRPNGQLDNATKSEIMRLGATKAVVIGGTGVISPAISRNLPPGVSVTTRLGGKTRYETSLEIAKYLESLFGHKLGVMAVSGTGFADALTSGAAAIKHEKSVVLFDNTSPSTKQFLAQRSIDAVGGAAVRAVSRAGIHADRNIVGQDRYETGKLVCLNYFEPTETIYIALGTNYPDGLATSVLSAKNDAPLLLSKQSLPPATTSVIQSGFGSKKVYFVSGPALISFAADNLITQL